MRTLIVISLTAAALLFTGCNAATGFGNPSVLSSTTSGSGTGSQGCVPLTQTISFSGTATLGASSAVSNALGLDVVSSVINTGNSSTYNGSNSDGTLDFTAQPGMNGLSSVQGMLQISAAAWNAALSQLGSPEGLCLQSMAFDLEVSDQTLFGGQVVLTVNGTQIPLAF